MRCERCKKDMVAWRVSWFNPQEICLECYEEEKKHPDYAAAKEAIYEQERLGNRNYAGIGLPADLEEKYKDVEEEEYANRI